MDNTEQSLFEFENDLKSFRMMRYDEIPDIDLYMEQVVAFVNRNLSVFSREDEEYQITPSMINNYVKYGIIPPPDKKKYKRRHIAYIYAVYFLKQVLTMNEIKDIIRYQIKCSGEKKAYEFFCNEIERALKNCCRCVVAEPEEFSVDDYSMKYSAIAIANKLYARKIIELQREPDEDSEDKKAEKKQEKQEKKEKKEMPKDKLKEQKKDSAKDKKKSDEDSQNNDKPKKKDDKKK